MALGNTHDSYGSLTKTFHWLTALFILTAFPLGMIAYNAPYDTAEELARKAMLFSAHKTVGIAAFFTAVLRILWALKQPRPGLLNAENRLEAFAAETAHWILYGCMVLVPLTGWIHHAASEGFAPIWWPFGQSLPLIPKDETIYAVFGSIHKTLTPVLLITILAHVGGALKHLIIDRDKTLQRMLPGSWTAPVPPAQTHSGLPIVTAVVVWVAALTLGALSAQTPETAAKSAELAEVQSDWVVQEGTLGIRVKQFGSDVTGSFANWTAEISFDEISDTDQHGSVTVTIDIASLKLGTVTQQAMGRDYFNVEAFPTAVFNAGIFAADAGYVARGNLTLRGETVPVELPFTLSITDGIASMQGTTDLQRLDFGIGQNMADESSLAFEVTILTELTAKRAE